MSGAWLLPQGAWDADGARFAAPASGRLAVWAEGADGAAVLHRADGTAVGFAMLGGCAFAGCEVAAGEALRIAAPAPPRRCVVLLRAAPMASPSLSGAWPRALLRGARRHPDGDAAAARASMDAALAAQDLDGALAALADMLAVARDDAATRQATAALLRHLSHHPMLRGAALGALAAALIEDPA
jgi:hypothetical protein